MTQRAGILRSADSALNDTNNETKKVSALNDTKDLSFFWNYPAF